MNDLFDRLAPEKRDYALGSATDPDRLAAHIAIIRDGEASVHFR